MDACLSYVARVSRNLAALIDQFLGSTHYDGGATVPTGSSLPVENGWFVGQPFSYHRVQEDSGVLNYYVHGHNAKIQMEYSYLHGNTFAGKSFSANRVWTQIQIMF